MADGYEVDPAELYGASATVRRVLTESDPLRPLTLVAADDLSAGHPGVAKALADLGKALQISAEVLSRTADAAGNELGLTGTHYVEQEDRARSACGEQPAATK